MRLLTPDPEAPALLTTVARSEPLTVLNRIMLVPALETENVFRMRVSGLRVGPYRVEASESMLPSDWQVVTNGVLEAGQTAEFTESVASGRPWRFYRVSQ